MSEVKFGTPAKTAKEWLESFVEDTRRYNKTIPGIFFRHKAGQEGYLRGLEVALELLGHPEGYPLPYTLGPNESVTFEVVVPLATSSSSEKDLPRSFDRDGLATKERM